MGSTSICGDPAPGVMAGQGQEERSPVGGPLVSGKA